MFKKEKIYYLAIIWLSLFILGATPVFATNSISIEFGEVDTDNQIFPILYESPDVITGFHLFITGMDIIDVYGGISEANNFYLDQGSTCWRDNECNDFITGNYTPVSTPIPSGSGVLLYVKYAEIGDGFDPNIIVGDETCLDVTEGFIIGPWIDGGPLVYEVDTGECMASPVDCNGDFYGSAYDDECGICSGGNSDHNANSDMDCAGICFGDAYIDDCGVCDAYENNDCFTYSIELSQGANLISFHALPVDVSINSIFQSLGDNANYIIAEGAGAYYMSGSWYGSLQKILAHEGYWLIVENAAVITIDDAVPTSINEDNLVYDLHNGNNLVSYPYSVGQPIDDAIDNFYLSYIFAIAGSAEAAQYTNGSWYGSLDYLNPSSGYWLVTFSDTQFQFNQPDYDAPPRNSSEDSRNDAPDLFTYTQSPYQAFYWVANAYIDNEPMIVGEDWIGTFYGDICVGARGWSGMSTYGIPTDVPVMGYDDGIAGLQNYIVAGEYPRFVVYDASEDTYYDANVYNNHVFEGALLAMYSVDEIKVEKDCLGVLGGHAYEDNCGECDLDPENDCLFDCNDIPGGEAFLDDCGICSGGDTGHEANSDKDDCGDCFDCTGFEDDCSLAPDWNADMDCNGDCGLSYGAAYSDDCGVCSGGYSGHLANSDQDCNGDCFGDAYEDDCSVCSSGDSGHVENTDKDCNGDCFGEAVIDDCGECSDGLSGHSADSDKDCNGDCFGDAFLDDCEICSGGGSDHTADSDKDCNGDCFGDAFLDGCGECSGGFSEHEENSDQDCNSECFGPALIRTYYFDEDGDGLGGDESEQFCDVDVPEGWVSNSADIDDSCTSNYHDCMDVCDGTDMFTTYYQDNDGDGFGSDISQQYCSGEVPENWVSNSSDTDDDCFSNIHDCDGVCDGDAIIQIYWYDNDIDGLGAGSAQSFCTAYVPDGWVVNNDDEDDNCYSNYHDCAGVCNGFSQVNIYYFDDDDDGLGGDTQNEFCSDDVPDGWVLNSDDVDDSCFSNVHDCAGVCDGDTVIDECGICGGDNSVCTDECGVPNGNNLCLDECGVPNGDNSMCADCTGTPYGDAYEDECDICDNDPSNDCVQDCAGEWGGNSSIDNCGSCDNDLSNDCVQDCADVWGGSAEYDECGVCGGSGIPYGECDCDGNVFDCAGACDGDAVLDNCGACDNDPENDCPFDCAGIPGGNAYLDDCGICSGPSTGHMPNSDVDQCGVCFGGNEAQQGCGCFNGFPSNYWYDFDNDGFGSCTAVEGECLPCEEDTECELFCGWDVPSDNWADNSDDSDDNCYSNVHDCAGVCDGNAVIQDFWFDNDDDGFGFGDEIQSYCTADVPEGWVPNNSDSDDNCYSNYHDCMDICDGSDEIITYFMDNDGDGLGNSISEEFCSGDIPYGWVENNEDGDDDCFSNIHDCANVCDGEAVIQTYWNDNDGDGLGDGIEQDFCNSEVPNGWVLNSDDEDDNCYSNYHDCAGDCNGFAQIYTYYLDADLDGLGDAIEQDFCNSEVPNGWVLNSDDEDDNCFSNYHDCSGVCDGGAYIGTWYADTDGDGLGDAAVTWDGCSAEVPDGFVADNTDEDDNCFSNIHDCFGVCDGGAYIGTWYADTDDDGLGDAAVTWDGCSAEVPDGFVADNTDADDNCFSNIHDCFGVCDGGAYIGTWYADTDGDGLGDAAVTWDGCSAEVPDGFVADNTDEDDNCFSNDIDGCGVCNGDDSTCTGCIDPDAFNYDCYYGEIPPCNNNLIIDDGNCIYYPEEFQFNQSQMQAFYIVNDAEIQQDDGGVDSLEVFTDWIGVFKDSVCVGAYPWVGTGTTIPTMGNDGTPLTENYLLTGDYPIFHIYDGSEGEYINTEVFITPITGGEYTGWTNFGFYFIIEMLGSVLDWYSIALDGVDLISFYSLPENSSVATVFSQVEDSNPKILGEGTSAFYYADFDQWLGTLTEIESTDGYWVLMDTDDTLDVTGIPADSSIVYNLHEHTNLISYPFAGFSSVEETIPEYAQGSIDAIIGEGEAAMNTADGWVGGLTELSGTKGYWFITNEEVSFSYNPPVEGAARKDSPIRSVPMEFAFSQSTQQAFYFVNSATIGGEPLDEEDLIIAYNGDVIVGSRYWYGETTDVPAMGYDPNNYGKYTDGYCETGDRVTFKVLDASTGELIKMEADGDIIWENNLIWYVETLKNVIAIPVDFHLGKPYPNPFNPVTTIDYDVPMDCEIELSIYDLRGRLVEQLISGYIKAGYYEIQWNAGAAASGIYFLRMVTPDKAITQKMILMK